jgi:hypothetical protein
LNWVDTGREAEAWKTDPPGFDWVDTGKEAEA